MGNKTNIINELTQFEGFREKVIAKLQNYSLQKLNPIFAGGGAFFDYDERIDVIYPNMDVKIFPALHPSSTLIQPEYLSTPTEDRELTTWTAWSKHIIVIERSYTQSRYNIHELETVPFYIRLFCDAARESFKSSIVFIVDGLPSELRVSVYPQRKYKKSKVEDLILIARRLIDYTDEETKQRVELICLSDKFECAVDKILKLSKQPINTNLSCCLACGARIKKESKFCNSKNIHGKKNPGNCRDKFHNWLRRRLGIKGIEGEREERERLYQELQDTIRTDGPFNAFDTFQDKHRELYDERHRGPKKRV